MSFFFHYISYFFLVSESSESEKIIKSNSQRSINQNACNGVIFDSLLNIQKVFDQIERWGLSQLQIQPSIGLNEDDIRALVRYKLSSNNCTYPLFQGANAAKKVSGSHDVQCSVLHRAILMLL